jgi:hypothetical protein
MKRNIKLRDATHTRNILHVFEVENFKIHGHFTGYVIGHHVFDVPCI